MEYYSATKMMYLDMLNGQTLKILNQVKEPRQKGHILYDSTFM